MAVTFDEPTLLFRARQRKSAVQRRPHLVIQTRSLEIILENHIFDHSRQISPAHF
jgi:hypothetical protein